MSEIKRKERPTDGNGEKSYTPISPEELSARRAKWEADRLEEEAWRRLHSEYMRAYGAFPYTVSLTEHDVLHFRTRTAINNLLTEHASPQEVDAVVTILKQVPTGSTFSDSSSTELKRRVKAVLTSVRALIAKEPKIIPEAPTIEVAPAPKPIDVVSMVDQARRLYSEGTTVRDVARKLGCSVGKAHALRKQAIKESQG